MQSADYLHVNLPRNVRRRDDMLQRYEKPSEYRHELETMKPEVVACYKKYCDRKTSDELVNSLRAIIGSKADTYAKIKERKYLSPAEYRDAWFEGLIKSNDLKLRAIMREGILREYAVLLLEYSFLNHKKEHTRRKLETMDREIYLGKNNFCIGIFVAPQYNKQKSAWESDNLKGNKVNYEYLTLNQIIYEGYLSGSIYNDTFVAKKISVNNLNDIINMFVQIKNNSVSDFEKLFIDCYIEYICSYNAWQNIPIMLPEYRWGKQKKYHTYRADYVIVNYYTGERLAIELSPFSSHMDKNREEARLQWIKENNKRNDYFFKYRVPTITFTDDDLGNVQNCFDMVKQILYVPDAANKHSFEELVKLL